MVDSKLREGPSEAIPATSPVRNVLAEATADPEGFWARAAGELPWFRRWDRVFVHEPPTFRWFEGGLTNMAFNAVDHQVAVGRGSKTALIALTEARRSPGVHVRRAPHRGGRTAAALRGLGVGRGDRVTIYMPTCPEAIVAMLATIRIGAIHSVVFAGFGHAALGDRIRASGSKVVLTADVTFRKGTEVALQVDRRRSARSRPRRRRAGRRPRARHHRSPPRASARHLLGRVPRRRGGPVGHARGGRGQRAGVHPRDVRDDRQAEARGAHPRRLPGLHRRDGPLGLRPRRRRHVVVDLGHRLDRRPLVHRLCAAACGRDDDRYEGALDYPNPRHVLAGHRRARRDRRLHVADRGPDADALRRGAAGALRHESPLRRVLCAGEVLNAPAWEWLQTTVFGDRVPVIDHMWQTETGGPVFGNPYGIDLLPIKPGSAGIPLPGSRRRSSPPRASRCRPARRGS